MLVVIPVFEFECPIHVPCVFIIFYHHICMVFQKPDIPDIPVHIGLKTSISM